MDPQLCPVDYIAEDIVRTAHQPGMLDEVKMKCIEIFLGTEQFMRDEIDTICMTICRAAIFQEKFNGNFDVTQFGADKLPLSATPHLLSFVAKSNDLDSMSTLFKLLRKKDDLLNGSSPANEDGKPVSISTTNNDGGGKRATIDNGALPQ